MADRLIGRGAFLGLVGAGVAGLFYGRQATDLVGRIVPNSVESIVPTSGWRIYTIGTSIPRLDPAAYRLQIGGAVKRPVTYTLADLRSLPRVEQVSDFKCVTGWRIKNVHWSGIRFKDVLAEAGLQPSANTLRFVSAEVPYDDTLTLPQALANDVLLALEMDGKPLSDGHGYPARVVMPSMYGYKGVKWVTRSRPRRQTSAWASGSSADTTRTRGSARRTASEPMAPVRMIGRFGRTERALHWVHATGFFAMLATGLILYLPALSELVARRNLVKNVHIFSAVGWALALCVVVALGDRRRLADDWREVEAIDADDRRWLGGRTAPQGRFNAGQKLNTIVTAAFAVLFAVSGFFLWLGERDHRFLFEGTGTVHETLMLASVAIVGGHLYLALIHPTTRHALRGMTLGDVREDWARTHHRKWVETEEERGV